MLRKTTCLIFTIIFIIYFNLYAGDRPQWGERHTRNMVSDETGLPDQFDPESGENIKWKVKLGTQSYSTPVISNGKIFIGTNNENPRSPLHKGDKSVLFCLNEENGSLCWQLVVPKLPYDIYWDWPKEGICSPATVEGNRVYIVSNRGEVLCLDINGHANGNDGPFKDESKHMSNEDEKPVKLTKKDADIIWLFDMLAEENVRQHDGAHSSILLKGNYLYVNTSNGTDKTHRFIRSPEAPSLIVLDKRTGKIVARDYENIGPNIFHSTWSSPTLGVVNKKPQIYFGGGDGIVYAFDSITSSHPGKKQKLNKIWWFDGDPTAPKDSVHKYVGNHKISPSNIKSMPVFYKGRVYYTLGGDIWWGKRKSWIKCIDATKTGDITKTGQLWSVAMDHHCCATPSIYNGLVFVGDCGKNIHCIDAETGKLYWSQKTHGPIWASALAADGKVYVGTRRGGVWIFAADKEKKLIHNIRLDSAICASPVAANGVLYIATLKYLYAIAQN